MPFEQLTGWEVVDGHHLHKMYRFPNFRLALDFVNRIGEAAEEQGHHPNLKLGWGRVEVEIFTHTVDGISEKDYILAATIDKFLQNAGA